MKKNIKIATLVALLGVFVACSSESTPTYSELGSENYPQKFYVEYIPCELGPDYSPEAFAQDMLPGWQSLLVEVDSTIVAAYGLGYESKPEDAEEDGYWQLVWNSKEDADEGWATWAGYEKTAEWSEETSNILVCGNKEDTFSFDAYMRRDVDSLGEFDRTNFNSNYMACSYNEGQGADELISSIDSFDAWLDSDENIDAPYGFMVLAPDYETEEFDFIWGDFHQTVEKRAEGNANFLAKASNIQAAFDEVASCQDVISYNTGQIPSS